MRLGAAGGIIVHWSIEEHEGVCKGMAEAEAAASLNSRPNSSDIEPGARGEPSTPGPSASQLTSTVLLYGWQLYTHSEIVLHNASQIDPNQ